MASDRRDRLTVRYERPGRAPERVTFEPRDDGRWDRIEQYHNGCKWCPRGHEIVDDVAVNGHQLDDGRVAAEVRGP